MPQPAEVERAARELADAFRLTQDDIARQLAAIANEDRQAAKVRRLRQLARSVEQQMAGLQADSKVWLEQRFPDVYALGGQASAPVLGEDFQWAAIHLEALQALASEAWQDILSATQFVTDETKKWVRSEARKQTTLSLTAGRTAQQAAREFVTAAAGEVAQSSPVGLIRYADGSYRRVADYADMLLRTTTARAFNAGTLNQLGRFGVGFVEVFDGSACGWTEHDDGDKANGKVVTIQDANLHPLSHPRCRRSFGGRPDVTSTTQASTAQPSTAEAQREDQAQAERNRTETLTRQRAGRNKREARAARKARTAR